MRTLLLFFVALLAGGLPNRQVLGHDRFTVLTFLSVECPLAALYSNRLNELHHAYANRGVRFVAFDCQAHDSDEEITAFAKTLDFEFSKDVGQAKADELGITRSPEVVLFDGDAIIYRGRIDDQYAPGNHGRSAPTRRDLEEAILEALAGRTISVPRTQAVGCLRNHLTTAPTASMLTYSGQIAAIFDARCVDCHRAGEVAPFSLRTYQDSIAWADAIREVIEQRRMPPWGAEGHFANDRSLTRVERDLILAWLDAGTPEGNPADRPAEPEFTAPFSADLVLIAPEVTVPKEGVLDYRDVVIDPGLSDDTWIQAVEIRPGNRKVVHHINVYLKPKNGKPNEVYLNDLGDYYLAMAVPGNSITRMPPGTAKMIPAGWNIALEIHYVPNGVEQTDKSSIALELADRAGVRRKMATRVLIDNHLCIQPGEKKAVTQTWTLEDDYTLFALYPHMHLRGRSMVFDALYPDGARETLLDVYRYDFAWQYRYVLSEPKDLPRGTLITCTALYDNSADNVNNPDPGAVVHAGRATTDEMFQAGFEICRTHEDLLRPKSPFLPLVAVAIAVIVVLERRLLAAKKSSID